MPALIKTKYSGTITHLGYMPTLSDGTVTSHTVDQMAMDFGGYDKDAHYGLTRPSCSRVTQQYPKGTDIRNTRQISILSANEMAEIAADLGLEALDPLWLGATIVIDGIPDFSHIPPSSRLQCERTGLTLTVDMQNRPCHVVAKTIEEAEPGHGKTFKSAANGKRGVTAWVERIGEIQVGDQLTLHVPDQRAWAP